ALTLACSAYALGFLFRATSARRAQVPRLAVLAVVTGAAIVAVGGIAAAVSRALEAASFAGSSERTADAARDVIRSSTFLAATLVNQLGLAIFGVGLIIIALNAMRAGLLTRFMGVLGIIVGVLFVVPLGASLPVVQAFWLLALGVLFLGRWPSGMPPAWVTGEAQPWPSQQELRERRDARRESEDRDGLQEAAEHESVEVGGSLRPDDRDASAEAAGTDERNETQAVPGSTHPVSQKRKRKRRR
ncbi:MAG: DUF4386 domain-containing protein, partial [Actinomycetota bacterium]|nr:DUF4386 domain-containing protein [Actinomycetota bacterium]